MDLWLVLVVMLVLLFSVYEEMKYKNDMEY